MTKRPNRFRYYPSCELLERRELLSANLDFSGGSTGTLVYSGNGTVGDAPLVASGINMNIVTGINSPANSGSANRLNLSGAVLSFTTGNFAGVGTSPFGGTDWLFSGGGTITITGTAPGIGINTSTTLLSGTFSTVPGQQTFVTDISGTLYASFSPIINTINPTMAAYFGWAGVTNWSGAVSPLDFHLEVPATPPSGFSSNEIDTVDVQTAPTSAPAITTAQLPPSTTVGGMIVDQATVTGLVNPLPSDTVTFNLYSSATEQDSTTLLYSNTQTLTLNGGTGTAISGAYTTGAVGTDYWVATYNGDSANVKVTSGPTDEPVTVNAATPALTTQGSETGNIVGSAVLNDTATLSGGYMVGAGTPTPTITFTLIAPNGATVYTETQNVTDTGNYSTQGGGTGSQVATQVGTYYWNVSYNANGSPYDTNASHSGQNDTSEQLTVVGGTPQLAITKVPDQATVAAGSTIGFTVTISNPGSATANGLILTDPLPPGGNEFFNWKIDTSGTGLGAGTTPADFSITGTPGSQSLAFSSAFLTSPDSLGGGQSISVHITTPTTVGDVSGGAVGLQAGVSSATYLGAAGNYGVLYIVGSGTHNLSITNVTLGANIGIGSAVGGNGIGNATFSGPGIVTGRVDFAPGQTNVFNNNNSANYGPASVNTNVAAVNSAIATVTSLSSSLGALSGTPIAINGTNSVNESAGTFHTVNGVTYSVFTVTSYSSGDGKLMTINGDGSGDPVVFNFAANSNVNLGGDIKLAGNGLNDDKVIWNFTSSHMNINLNNNASSFFGVAFHGIILAPNDAISLVNANLSGRVYGGDSHDMQLVSGLTQHAPVMNTATVTAGNLTASNSATITITGSFKPSAHFADVIGTTSGHGPAEVRGAYGINSLGYDGTGQTIAIVDAYDDPSIVSAVDTFDNQFSTTAGGANLFGQYGPAQSFLTVVNQNGQAGNPPATDPTGGWETETALDVEWAHAMAPGAQIVLVEANSQSLSDLMSAVKTAASLPGVSVVSMSWGFQEGVEALAQDEATYDSYLTTPAGHQGVTFVASTGDYGSADPEYPAFSPNVVAVGGTSLYLNADGSYLNETGWGYNSSTIGAFIGSGGGISQYEAQPSYQSGVQSTGYRTTPDVAFLADPGTGAWIADTYNLPGDSPWEVVGGTSLAAPSWAGLFALVNQGRVATGGATLGSAAPNEAQQALYSMPAGGFNSITSGTNGGYTAQAGYNLVTGLGTPVANVLIPGLVGYQYSAGSVANNTAGVAPLAPSNAIMNANAPGTGGNTMNAIHNVFIVEVVGSRGFDAGHLVNATSAVTSAPMTAALPTLSALPTLGTGTAGASMMPAWYSSAAAPQNGMPPGFAVVPTSAIGTLNARLLALFGDQVKDTDLLALAATPADRATHLLRGNDAAMLVGGDGENLRVGGDRAVSGFGESDDGESAGAVAGPSDDTGEIADAALIDTVLDAADDGDFSW